MLWDSYFEDICFGSCTVVNGHVIINLIICVVFNSSYMFISYFFCIVFGFILDKHFCTKLRKHYYISDVMREGNADAICVRALSFAGSRGERYVFICSSEKYVNVLY